MEDATLIRFSFSSLAELEEAAWGGGPHDAVLLQFVGGNCTVVEAARMYRLLEERHWEVDEASTELLRSAARHFDQIEGLQTSIELLDDDLNSQAPMSRICFDTIRSAANAVVISAHASHSRNLLDEIVIDAQRVGRVCRALRFGADDVPVAELQPEDLDWLLAGGHGGKLFDNLDGAELQGVHAGGEHLVLTGGHGGDHLSDLDGAELQGVHAGGEHLVLAGAHGGDHLSDLDGVQPLRDDNPFAVLASLGDDVGEATPGAGGPLPLSGLVDGADLAAVDVLEHGLLPALFDGDEEAPAGLIKLKEQTVVALLQLKIRCLMEAIVRAKERVILA